MKKAIIIASIALSLLCVFGVAAPIMAADPGGSPPVAGQGASKLGRGVLLGRLLLVRDEAKIDALLAKAVENGRITAAQSDKIKAFWTLRHEQATRRAVLRGLARIQDEAKLKEVLDRALANGRITREQTDRIIAAWEIIHSR